MNDPFPLHHRCPLNLSAPLRLRVYGQATGVAAPQGGQAGAPLYVSLETALNNLEQLPRMFVELDGSFLWTGQSPEAPLRQWQLEGTIYDDGEVVRYIDLRGDCPLSTWKTFLAAFDATLATVTLQLVEDDLIVPGQWLEQQSSSEE